MTFSDSVLRDAHNAYRDTYRNYFRSSREIADLKVSEAHRLAAEAMRFVLLSPAAAEALAETPRETFEQEGWALRRKADGQWLVKNGHCHPSMLRAVTNAEFVARACAGTVYEPICLKRTVTVQVHEPAPRSEPTT